MTQSMCNSSNAMCESNAECKKSGQLFCNQQKGTNSPHHSKKAESLNVPTNCPLCSLILAKNLSRNFTICSLFHILQSEEFLSGPCSLVMLLQGGAALDGPLPNNCQIVLNNSPDPMLFRWFDMQSGDERNIAGSLLLHPRCPLPGCARGQWHDTHGARDCIGKTKRGYFYSSSSGIASFPVFVKATWHVLGQTYPLRLRLQPRLQP